MTVHSISLHNQIDSLLGTISDYSVVTSDGLDRGKPIEVASGKWVDPVVFTRSTESFLLTEMNFIDILLSVNTVIKRLSRQVALFMEENKYNSMISYPLNEDRIITKNDNDIYLMIKNDRQKWDYRVIVSIMLVTYG